ncbi:MAG: NTP transferase domain-containing protein [Desulfobacteraceae bacterium]|nr:NTP transferase domain-containing protein [Desulfobacteraceae bacterium]
MCAGVGERLSPLTYNTPKSLFELDGKPLLAHFLEGLVYSEADIKSVHIIVGHLRKSFKKLIGSEYRGLKIRYLYNPLYKITGAAQSLYLAGPILLKNATLIAEGDHYLHPDLFKKLMQSGYDNCTLVNSDLSNMSHPEHAELAYGYEGLLSMIKWLPPYPDNPIGKSIGIFKLSKKASNSMFTFLEKHLLEDGPAIKENIIPFNKLAKIHDVYYHLTGGLESIEIDFFDDYVKAKEMVFS